MTYPREFYVVHYATPEKGADVWALMEMLQQHGATEVSADSRTVDATWPSETHEQQFDGACIGEDGWQVH